MIGLSWGVNWMRAVGDKAFGAARVLEQIATVPEEKRKLAWWAAKQSYLRTAQSRGYNEHDAEEWASEMIFRLQIAFITGKHRTAVK
jgi:hypothetical protein